MDDHKEELRELLLEMGVAKQSVGKLMSICRNHEEATINYLENLTIDDRDPEASMYIFLKSALVSFIRRERRAKEEQRDQDAYDEMVHDWDKAKERGYRATPEQLLAQIERLYATDEITKYPPKHLGPEARAAADDPEALKTIFYGWALQGIEFLQKEEVIPLGKTGGKV